MFNWLKKESPRKMAETSWQHHRADGSYVADVRKTLDAIATELQYDSRTAAILNRFNYHRSCAEFVTEEGGVIARIQVHGECGVPYKAIVQTNLCDEAKKAFHLLFPQSPENVEFKVFFC